MSKCAKCEAHDQGWSPTKCYCWLDDLKAERDRYKAALEVLHERFKAACAEETGCTDPVGCPWWEDHSGLKLTTEALFPKSGKEGK